MRGGSRRQEGLELGEEHRERLDPTGRGRQRWMNRWKPALNAFAIASEGRIFPTP
jgi:hypothetical protein